jgi:hypothetical protein
MDLAGIRPGLCGGDGNRAGECERRETRDPARRAHYFFVSFIGSHWCVSEPQKSTQSW